MNDTPVLVGDPIDSSSFNPAPQTTNQLMASVHFQSAVYLIEKPEFLAVARKVSTRYLQQVKKDKPKLDPIYPLYQTDNMYNEQELGQFMQYTAQTAWNILAEQGYKMDDKNTFFTEMWCQEHHTTSGHDEHIHNMDSQISGFYFLDCPKDCSRLIIHDPRPGKKQINLPELDASKATYASTMINFEPKPGLMIFTNSWLPHQIGRNGAKTPIRFIHFNIGIRTIPQMVPPPSNQQMSEAIVI